MIIHRVHSVNFVYQKASLKVFCSDPLINVLMLECYEKYKLWFELFKEKFAKIKGQHHCSRLEIRCFFQDFSKHENKILWIATKGSYYSIYLYIKKNYNFFISKWWLYTMTAEGPLNLRCSAADSTTAIILAVKKKRIFSYL